jgi:leader peptidase (prepilin peptidase) / N-methyltransferase
VYDLLCEKVFAIRLHRMVFFGRQNKKELWMAYIIAAVFGLIGCVIGYFIPNVSNKIIEVKLSQRQRQKQPNFLDQKKWIVIMAISNGILWGGTGYFTESVLTGVLVGCMVTMAIMFTVIDMIIHIIPNEMLIVGLVLGIVFQLTTFGFKNFLIALACMASIVILFTIVGLIFGLNKIGAGDVKLAGLMGLILGYPLIIYAALMMCGALVIFTLGGLATGKMTHVTMFAFAPFIMLGLVTGLGLALFPDFIGIVQSLRSQ